MMRLLCKVGLYAGLVMEYPDHVGENLLQNGLAELPPQGADLAPGLEVAVSPSAETPEKPAWPLKTLPEKYLERNPDGKHAALAREVLSR